MFYFLEICQMEQVSPHPHPKLAIDVLLTELFDLKMERIQMIKLGKQAENKYIGVNSVIMD